MSSPAGKHGTAPATAGQAVRGRDGKTYPRAPRPPPLCGRCRRVGAIAGCPVCESLRRDARRGAPPSAPESPPGVPVCASESAAPPADDSELIGGPDLAEVQEAQKTDALLALPPAGHDWERLDRAHAVLREELECALLPYTMHNSVLAQDIRATWAEGCNRLKQARVKFQKEKVP